MSSGWWALLLVVVALVVSYISLGVGEEAMRDKFRDCYATADDGSGREAPAVRCAKHLGIL